jgi:peroxiredoxin Q/BCP
MLKQGDSVAAFTLKDETGKEVSLDDFSGKKKVVYFYPKDDTPGCTKEACSFRDEYARIQEKGGVVIGISADSEKSHGKFKDKYQLPFILLSDPDKVVINAFGVWGEKKMYGKSYEGILRATFILDENNVVIKAFPKVKPEDHGKEVLSLL